MTDVSVPGAERHPYLRCVRDSPRAHYCIGVSAQLSWRTNELAAALSGISCRDQG
jgi:hypothetical protein